MVHLVSMLDASLHSVLILDASLHILIRKYFLVAPVVVTVVVRFVLGRHGYEVQSMGVELKYTKQVGAV